MDIQRPSKTQAASATDIGVRIAHIESKMDFVASREDVALVRTEMANMNADLSTEIANSNARIAVLKGDLLTSIAQVKALVANRDASLAAGHHGDRHGRRDRSLGTDLCIAP